MTDQLAAYARQLAAELGFSSGYVFRSAAGSGTAGATTPRARQLLVFRNADEALLFAQRNRLGAHARLQQLSLLAALQGFLQVRQIAAILFVHTIEDDLPAGRLPAGRWLTRGELLQALQSAERVEEERNGEPL